MAVRTAATDRLSSSAAWVGPGAADTGGRCWTDLQAFGGNRLAAAFAPPVLSLFESFECPVQFFQVLARLSHQGGDVGTLEGGGAPFGVVLVVHCDQGVRRDDPVEVAAQCGRPSQGVGAVGREACAGGREGGRAGPAMIVPGYFAHTWSALIPGRLFHRAIRAPPPRRCGTGDGGKLDGQVRLAGASAAL